MELSPEILAPYKDNIVDIDLGGDYLRQNWKTILPEWTKRPPIYVVNNGIPQVFCARYEDAMEAFNDPERFTVEVPKVAGTERFDLFMGVKDIAHVDGEDHTRARALMAAGFGPAHIERLDSWIVETIDKLLDEVIAKGNSFEAMRDFCSHLIARIVLTGVFRLTPDNQKTLMRMHEAFALTIGIEPGQPFPEEYLSAFKDTREMIRQLVAERRANPGADMISDLANARDGDKKLSDDELFANLFSVSAASLGTTANAMGAVLIALCSHQDQFDLVRADPELVPQAIEEAMRFGIGLLSFTRFATRDTEIAGTKIWKSMPVHISRQAAALDAAEFPDPLRFDVHRKFKRTLVFGAGPHRCIGFRLGRHILRRSLEGVIARLPNLRFTDENFKPVYGGMFGELKPQAIPLTYG